MSDLRFPHLFSTLGLGPVTAKNRILSTGHQTWLARDGRPSDDLVAYHERRAAGGAALIVIEAARVHPSSLSGLPEIVAYDPACTAGYRAIAEACHRHGCLVFGQLSHSGRVSARWMDGMRQVVYSASPTPDNRFHSMPRAMPEALIHDVVSGYAAAARNMADAGLDGVEVSVSHGLLPSQFLNPAVNRRTDRYGGDFTGRMRFLAEVLAAVRDAIGVRRALGIRISANEVEPDGLDSDAVLAICRALDRSNAVDYINTTFGSMAGLGGSVHVVPPMQVEHAYVAPHARLIRAAVSKPVLVAGRINQPQLAEQVIAAGQADMCGMTRALISDPDLPNKARDGDPESIRACIGCNQGCIGHFHMGVSLSCIQNPEAGRERRIGAAVKSPAPRRVYVAGGGPAGMQAALAAAECGHRITLFEGADRLGGQVNLAQRLPGRAEFGGLVTNLQFALRGLNVDIRLREGLSRRIVERDRPHAVIVATGAAPYRPPIDMDEAAHVVDAWQVLREPARVGTRVVVADWRCDWVGLGVAELLAMRGCEVRLAVNGLHAGQNLQPYLRDHWVGAISRLGVQVIPYVSLYGADADTVYLRHSVTGEAVPCEGVDTLVLAQGHTPVTELEQSLRGLDIPVHLAGDCLSPRSAEEAVYEGLLAGRAV